MNLLDDYGEILTVRQVAAVLGIARNSVYQAAAAGQIPSIRVGRRILFAKRSLEFWLSAGTQDSPRLQSPTRGTRETPHLPPQGLRQERRQPQLRRTGRGSASRRRLSSRF